MSASLASTDHSSIGSILRDRICFVLGGAGYLDGVDGRRRRFVCLMKSRFVRLSDGGKSRRGHQPTTTNVIWNCLTKSARGNLTILGLRARESFSTRVSKDFVEESSV